MLYIIQEIFILRIYNILLRILWFSDYSWIPQKQSRYIPITMFVSFAWNMQRYYWWILQIYRDKKKLGYIPILAWHSPQNVYFITYDYRLDTHFRTKKMTQNTSQRCQNSWCWNRCWNPNFSTNFRPGPKNMRKTKARSSPNFRPRIPKTSERKLHIPRDVKMRSFTRPFTCISTYCCKFFTPDVA